MTLKERTELLQNEKNLLTIGLPVRNGMPYLPIAVDSLLGQTYPTFKLLVADNASEDGTDAYIRTLQRYDPRVEYHRHEKPLTAWENFRWLLQSCDSPYFMWAAADDWWSPNWIDAAMKGLRDRSFLGFFGAINLVDESGNELSSHIAHGRIFEHASIPARYERLFRFLSDYEGKGKANLIYSVFRTSELMHTMQIAYEKGMDFDCAMVFEFLKQGPILIDPQTTFYKRMSSTSESGAKGSQVGAVQSNHRTKAMALVESRRAFRNRMLQYDVAKMGGTTLLLRAVRLLKPLQFIMYKMQQLGQKLEHP